MHGREPELALTDAFLDRASGVLLIEGEPGIGKTTIWTETVSRARARGHIVLSARPAEAETKLAMSTVGDLFEDVPSTALAPLPGPQRRALETALLRAAPSGAPPDPRTIATSIRSLLIELARERPVVVAIDDAHWLDSASATMLEFALRRSAEHPVAWVFARRTGGSATVAVERAVAPPRLTCIDVGPLALDALHHLLHHRCEAPLSRAALVRIHETSGGNPFYALELARALDDGAPGAPGGPLPLPASLRALVAARIPRLAPDARDALLAAAALSRPTVALVERAASPEGLAEAEESGLVRVACGRVEFVHPLYASAVYSAAATQRRGALHRRLARLVADPEEQARHLAAATVEPDADVAAALEAASVLARRRGAWAPAGHLLEQAARLSVPPHGDAAHRRRIAAAEHLIHAGDRPAGRALLEATVAGPLPAELRGEALRLLAELAYNDGHLDEAGRLFTDARGHARDHGRLAAIEIGLGNVNAAAWRFAAGADHARRALARAEAHGEPWLVAEALAQCARLDFMCGRGLDSAAVERALALEDVDRVTPLQRRPSMQAGLLEFYEGRHAQARERLTEVCAAARDRGDESDVPFVLLWLSFVETRCGDLAAALSIVDEGLVLAVQTGSPSTQAWLCAQRAYVQAHRGAIDEALGDAEQAQRLVERSGYENPKGWIASATALAELSRDRPDAAWASCQPLIAEMFRRGVGDAVAAFFVPLAVEALVRLGRLDEAQETLDAFEKPAHRLRRAWGLAAAGQCRALLLAARGDLAAAGAAASSALEHHAEIDAPFDLARTLLVAGVIQRRRRHRREANESFRRAVELFDAAGAVVWAERARAELARVGLRRSDGDLTEGERRVAELTAQGLTNREVAATLYLSPKTVEANLCRIYRKLGIRSRAELGSLIARAPRLQT